MVADPEATPARKEAVDIVFPSVNRFLGVAVGEHLGYLFTGVWTILDGAAVLQTVVVPGWLAYIAWALWLVGVGIATLWL